MQASVKTASSVQVDDEDDADLNEIVLIDDTLKRLTQKS